jgi:pimeloyl-ACP methyl ester carboxylesterase
MSDDHAQDIIAVASYLKKTANIPVWLVGSSMGTISATNSAIRIRQGIDGLVLTASKTRSNKKWGAIYKSHPNIIIDMDLEKITVPTIIIHHKKDKCVSSPPEEVPRIKEGLVNASKIDLLYFSGGKDPGGKDGCIPNGFHAFNGIDDEVIEAISKFIISNSK